MGYDGIAVDEISGKIATVRAEGFTVLALIKDIDCLDQTHGDGC
jgi:hypothetical protein